MSKQIFELNLKRVRNLRDLKDTSRIFIIDTRMPKILRRPLYLKEDGLLTSDLTKAVLFDDLKHAESNLKPFQEVVTPCPYDIELMVISLMTENQKYMDHIQPDYK